ncbi:MAG: TIR domain-containing protein [Pirellulaceae bacterium]|nr:TIR domain-containing protein [Pirellulaceae bacterium]
MPTRPWPEKFLVAFSLAGPQRELVRAIAEAVEQRLGHGTVFFDEWYEHYLAGEGADLKLQKIYGTQSTLAVLCVSKDYDDRPWTRAEYEAIRARMFKARASRDQRERLAVLPLRVGDGDVEGILETTIAPDVRERSAAEVAQLIGDRLGLIEPGLTTAQAGTSADPHWPASPPTLSWPMADHSGAREAFAQLLTAGVDQRYLPIRGASETGKSHITRQMLANALAIPDLACGRFDFKGTTDMDREINALVQELGVPAPSPGSRLDDRLRQILDGLKQRARPTLLIFDTYEMAGDAADWIEKQLLPSLIRAAWLRVVIAGQKLPDTAGAVWSAVAQPTLQLVPPPAEEWFDYGRQHHDDLTLAFVEEACRRASNRASLLAQLLGPAF